MRVRTTARAGDSIVSRRNNVKQLCGPAEVRPGRRRGRALDGSGGPCYVHGVVNIAALLPHVEVFGGRPPLHRDRERLRPARAPVHALHAGGDASGLARLLGGRCARSPNSGPSLSTSACAANIPSSGSSTGSGPGRSSSISSSRATEREREVARRELPIPGELRGHLPAHGTALSHHLPSGARRHQPGAIPSPRALGARGPDGRRIPRPRLRPHL